jgi:hypothetical protein
MAAGAGVAVAQHELGTRSRQEHLALTFPNQLVRAKVLAKLLGSIESKAVFSVFRIGVTIPDTQGGSGELTFDALLRSDWKASSEGHRAKSRIIVSNAGNEHTPADQPLSVFIRELLAGDRGGVDAGMLLVRLPNSGGASKSDGIENVEWQAVGNSAWASIAIAPIGRASHIKLDATGDLTLLANHDLTAAPATFFLTGETSLPGQEDSPKLRIRGVGRKLLNISEVPLSIANSIQSSDPKFLDESL